MKSIELKEHILKKPLPNHISIILDGNGRWAKKRLLPRVYGHARGIKALQNLIEYSSKLGINYLSVFAFSTENWNRPQDEVTFIMSEVKRLLKNYEKLVKLNVRFIHVGLLEGLESSIVDEIKTIEEKTSKCNGMKFILAFNYGGKSDFTFAVKNIANKVKNNILSIEDINEEVVFENLISKDVPNIDLLIRTSGECRISNYMLWQLSYAEMIFPSLYWPDFKERDFYQMIDNFQNRNRRFGSVEEKI